MNRAPALPLTPEHRATLERWLRAGTTAQRVVLRSRIVLLAADGLPSKYIAQRLGTSQDTVRVWRRRFAAGGPDVLTTMPRAAGANARLPQLASSKS